jgi:hypothetical protein
MSKASAPIDRSNVAHVRASLDSGQWHPVGDRKGAGALPPMRDVVSAIAVQNWAQRAIRGPKSGETIELEDLAGLHAMLMCGLCRGTLREPVFLRSCQDTKHYFCHECLWEFMHDRANEPKCPTCKTYFTPNSVAKDAHMKNIALMLAGEPEVVVDDAETAAAGQPSPGLKRGRGEGGGGGGGGAASGGLGAGKGGGAVVSGGGGGGSPPAGEPPRERYTYQLQNPPLPPGFPNIFAAKGGGGTTNSASMIKKILVVPCSQSVERNKEYILGKMAEARAQDTNDASYRKAEWSVRLFVGPPSGQRRELGAQRGEERLPLHEAVRKAMRELGKPCTRSLGETGLQLKAGEKAEVLETVWVQLAKK